VNDASQEILQKDEAKQEEMYDRVEVELRGVHQALHSSHAMSTMPLSSEELELGDDPNKLCRLDYAIEYRLCQAQEETEQDTQALKQVKEVVVEFFLVAE